MKVKVEKERAEETKTKPAKYQWGEKWYLDNWNYPYRKIKIFHPI